MQFQKSNFVLWKSVITLIIELKNKGPIVAQREIQLDYFYISTTHSVNIGQGKPFHLKDNH